MDCASGAASITALLQQHDLRKEMGKRAAAYAREHFSIHALTNNLIDVVEDALQTKAIAATPSGTTAYKPSHFAELYERHKQICGWYASFEIQKRSLIIGIRRCFRENSSLFMNN